MSENYPLSHLPEGEPVAYDVIPVISEDNRTSALPMQYSLTALEGQDAELVDAAPPTDTPDDPSPIEDQYRPSSIYGNVSAQEHLLRSCMQGDELAFSELWGHYRHVMTRFCQSRLGRGSDIEDVVQEIGISVYQSLSQGNYTPHATAGFEAYLFAIARKRVVDFRRTEGRNKSDPHGDVPDILEAGPSAEDVAMNLELGRQIHTAIAALSERKRRIVGLRLIHGMNSTLVAETMNSTPSTVRVELHRILKILRTDPDLIDFYTESA